MEPKNFPEKELLEKYLNGTLTESESIQLFSFLKENPIENDPAFETLLQEVYLQSFSEQSSISADGSQRILERLLVSTRDISVIMHSPNEMLPSRGRIYSLQRSWLRYAAAAVLFFIIGVTFVFIKKDKKASISNAFSSIKILPGTNRAVLKLANGKEIILDSAHNTIAQNGKQKIKNNSGRLDYEGAATTVEYHTLSTPRGGQYKLQLPDGTDVWLNAESSINYPTAFTGSERNVKITGEVYFEVTKNPAMPFKVHVNQMEITVLGTHFNVNAYEDEPSINTTLLEGLVRIHSGKNQQMIHPGQEAKLDKNNAFKVIADVNVKEIMAWKNGYFLFHHSDLPTVMRQLSRWYDVDIQYSGNLPEMKFAGEIPRNTSLTQALKILGAANIHFSVEGKKIIVMP